MTRTVKTNSIKLAALRLAIMVSIVVLPMLSSGDARAESRLYYLRVTLRSGERFETISASDPFSYCSRNGGAVTYLRNYSLIYSPQMKVKILRTWIEPTNELAANWSDILWANGMLKYKNHKTLPRLQPLSLAQMRQPE